MMLTDSNSKGGKYLRLTEMVVARLDEAVDQGQQDEYERWDLIAEVRWIINLLNKGKDLKEQGDNPDYEDDIVLSTQLPKRLLLPPHSNKQHCNYRDSNDGIVVNGM